MLVVGSNALNRVVISKVDGGTITPELWQTNMLFNNWEQERRYLMARSSFDWEREIEVTYGPAMTGTTYVALVTTNYRSAQTVKILTVPAYEVSTVSAWYPTCADGTNKMNISGSMRLVVTGLEQDQVIAAAREALAMALDVNPSLLRLTQTGTQIVYEIELPEPKGAVVKKNAASITADKTRFTQELLSICNRMAMQGSSNLSQLVKSPWQEYSVHVDVLEFTETVQEILYNTSRIEGGFTMTVPNANMFIDDGVAQEGVREGIALAHSTPGHIITANSVELTSVTRARRLRASQRRLSESVKVTYIIVVPTDVKEQILQDITVIDLTTAIQLEVAKKKGSDYEILVLRKTDLIIEGATTTTTTKEDLGVVFSNSATGQWASGVVAVILACLLAVC
jgi:hypothetical protein